MLVQCGNRPPATVSRTFRIFDVFEDNSNERDAPSKLSDGAAVALLSPGAQRPADMLKSPAHTKGMLVGRKFVI
jgi:hypothetical protein